MNTSKAAVVVSGILGKICSIAGYTIAVLFGLPFLAGGYGSEVATYVLASVFLLVGVFLIVVGAKTKHLIKRFKQYVLMISKNNMTDLQELAKATSQSPDFVRRDLQKMIDKKFFTNAFIDIVAGKIVIGNHTQPITPEAVQPEKDTSIVMESVKCSGCGAANSRPKGMPSNCDYCGTLLK